MHGIVSHHTRFAILASVMESSFENPSALVREQSINFDTTDHKINLKASSEKHTQACRLQILELQYTTQKGVPW